MATATIMVAAVLAMQTIVSVFEAFFASVLFGLAIGGILTVLPIAWADFFGRRSYGAIRGIALAIQVVGQASGPLISGALRDVTGDYSSGLYVYAGFAIACFIIACLLRHPVQRAG
jgi:MFS family permease